ncbi:hypothetical protein IFM89_039577 [Coptis chinensis]|uniref:Uncharacterized protein n=1 Tax=Coptis chinensis TaxID=261450 RepID=A0A835GXU2_9MAGN|nr:hypothetical protein IFM89_039577 [Coptis chinensis]
MLDSLFSLRLLLSILYALNICFLTSKMKGSLTATKLVLVISWCPTFRTCSTHSLQGGVLPLHQCLQWRRKKGPRDTRPINPMTGKCITPNKSSAADELKETADDGKDASEDSSNP